MSPKPVVIAHRGASGYLPEHTLAAKALAYAMGADYLEQDVVATKDDELIVLHDIFLDRTTDVAARYPDRCRDDGRYYARDFDLAEIRALKVGERRDAEGKAVYRGRYPLDANTFRLHTLAEELSFVAHLAESVGRPVGIYPEIKHPAMHRADGIDIAQAVLATLGAFGYNDREDTVFLQCFDAAELIRIRTELGCDLKLVQLIGDNAWTESDTDYDAMRSPAGLQRVAETADGIGPWIPQLYRIEGETGRVRDSGLVAAAHYAGLFVHPYTARRDDLPPGFTGFSELLRFLFSELEIDGLFTDFPDIVVERLA